jgi:3-carboxy-cis,cis-muconate cycloisomerase
MTFSSGTGLTGSLFADPEMADILSDRSWLAAMLDFEAALAKAEAVTGVIPHDAAEVITSCCAVDLYDISEIGRRTTLAGNPAIPMVAMLTEKVREKDAAAAEFVHFGATSQDVIDSGLGELLLDGRNLVFERLRHINRKLAELARTHRQTIMVGRTLQQHALPLSFGLKCANWLHPLTELEWKIFSHKPRAQFGGANGTLAALEGRGIDVIEAMKRGGVAPDAPLSPLLASIGVPTHTAREPLQTLASDFGILCSTFGKIARDIALLMQTEVAEVFEPAAPGKGGSSTLPHKRNPVHTTAIIACALRTPGLVATMLHAGLQEHERGVGGWHAEWDTMRALLSLTGAASLHMQTLLEGLEVDTTRMRQNLELTNGLIMAERVTFALAPSFGKSKAKAFMEAACKRATTEKRHLREVLVKEMEIPALDLDMLFDPTTYLGSSSMFIDMILKQHELSHNHFDGVLV